jgi:hypothetical protein
MAFLFGLAAECGASQGDADALAHHFAPWDARTLTDATGHWWCHVVPAGVSRSGIESADDAAAMTALGHELYERLRSAPPLHRFALGGVETDEFRTYAELLEERELQRFPGLVLADPLWDELGRPEGFERFAEGYRWIPYEGERYEPSTGATPRPT